MRTLFDLLLNGGVLSVLCSIVVPALVAWLTAKITSRSEVIKAYRDKRAEVYDEVLNVLDKFRVDPSVSLDESFSFELMRLSNRVRVYGSKGVLSALKEFANSINKYRIDYGNRINEIDRKYVRDESFFDEETGEYCESTLGVCSGEELDRLYAKAKDRFTPSPKEALVLVKPVLDELKKSERGFLFPFWN